MKEDFSEFASLPLEELEKRIAYHDRLYWDLGKPEISDEEYHALTRALAALAPDHELLRKIHTPRLESAEGKVHHAKPLLSLDKAYSLEEVLAWAKKYVRSGDEMLLVQPKYDGISAIFDGHILATRGDGETGDDISGKLSLLELEAPGYRGALDRPARGEIVFRNGTFAKFKAESGKLLSKNYKNYRNTIAGLLGQKADDPDARVIDYLFEKFHLRLTLADYSLISERVTYDALSENWGRLVEKLTAIDYPIDGIVLKLADLSYAESLGNTEHHPRGAIAYKFTNRSAETTLRGVEWSFGKNCLTPVALLEPVEMNGITIRRATLHNAQNVIDKDIQIGDTVTVERAGDVIPYIRESVPGLFREPVLIENCPGCGEKLVRRGPELCCINPDCEETLLQKLAGAVKSLKIEYLGIPTLRKMLSNFHIRHLKDLFELTQNDLKTLPGFQEKSAANLYTQIQSARVMEDFQLLAALNLPGIGPNIAKLIFKVYDFPALRQAGEEQLSAIAGIGPERAALLVSELSARSVELDELLAAIRVLHRENNTQDLPKICFTGEMPKKRSYYENLARAHGFEVANSVTGSLALLVAADVSGSSTKLVNARKFNVKIQSLQEFLQSVNAPEEQDGKDAGFVQTELF